MLTGDLKDSTWARTFGFKRQHDGGKKYKSDAELEQFWEELVAESPIKPITVRGWQYLLNRNLHDKEKHRKIAEIESVFFDGYLFPNDEKDILRYTQAEGLLVESKSMLSTKGTRFSRHCKLKLYYDFSDNTFWLSPVHPSIVDDDLKLYYHAMKEDMKPNTLQSVSDFNAATEKSLYSQLNKCVPTTTDERSGKRLPKICIQIPNPADVKVSLESNNWVEVEDLSLSHSFGKRTVYVAVPTITFPVDPVLEEWSEMIRLRNASEKKNIPSGLRNADGSTNTHGGQPWDDTNFPGNTGINFCPRDEEPVKMGRTALYAPVTLKMLVVVKIRPSTKDPPDFSWFLKNPSLQLDTNKLRDLSKLLEPHVIVCEAFELNDTMDVEVGTILQLRLDLGTSNLCVRRMYTRTVETVGPGEKYTYTETPYETPLPISLEAVKKTTFDITGFVKLFPTKEMQSATAKYLDKDGQVPYQFYNKQKKLDYNIDNQKKVYEREYDVTCRDAWDRKDGIRSSLSIKNARGTIVLKCCRSAGTILWALRKTAPVLFLPSDSAGKAYVELDQRMINNIPSDDEHIETSIHDVWRVSAVVKTTDRQHTSLFSTTGDILPPDVDNTVWKSEGVIGDKKPSFNVCCLCPNKMLSCWEPIVRRYHHGGSGSKEKYYAYFPGTSNIKGDLPNCMYCGESYENHETKVACDESSTKAVFNKRNTAPPIE